MENQILLKKKKNKKENKKKNLEFKNDYFSNLKRFIEKNYRIIIIILIVHLIILIENNNSRNISKKKNNLKIENGNITNYNNSILNQSGNLIEDEELEQAEKEISNTDNMTIIIQKANNYIFNCLKGNLLKKLKKTSEEPKITGLISSYNSEKTIIPAIRSIQNQKMEEIEILIVDDASTDKSLEIIEKLQKKDKRIKIIKNKINRGPLYTKSIGVLSAKGKYIMQLDSDDLFINENIFNICYNEVENNNLDILEFSGFRSRKKLLDINKKPLIPIYLRFKPQNIIVKQPELSFLIYLIHKKKIIRLIDGYLWGKCISNEVYRKALDVLGEETYTKKIFYGDDRIVNFVLFRVAKSFKYIKEYGIIYYSTPNSIFNSKNLIRNCHDELINILTMFNLTKNSNHAIFAAFELRYRWNRIINPGLNEENKKYAKLLIKNIVLCKYISKRSRQIIAKYYQFLK